MSRLKQKRYWLYVLKLEDSKFYIGVTSKTPEERYLEHKNGFYAAEWTKIYKPLAIEQSKDLGFTTYEDAENYENKVTRKYVEKYGIDNVRGGNLTYRGRLVKHFGYYWHYEDWKLGFWIGMTIVWMALTVAYIIIERITQH